MLLGNLNYLSTYLTIPTQQISSHIYYEVDWFDENFKYGSCEAWQVFWGFGGCERGGCRLACVDPFKPFFPHGWIIYFLPVKNGKRLGYIRTYLATKLLDWQIG